MKYLAAYVSRTALGPQRILAEADGQVTFACQDREDRQEHTLILRP